MLTLAFCSVTYCVPNMIITFFENVYGQWLFFYNSQHSNEQQLLLSG